MLQEFFFAAWPWVACGLMTAIVLAGNFARNKTDENVEDEQEEKRARRAQAYSFYMASVLTYVTAVMKLFEDNVNDLHSPIWFSLGTIYLSLGLWFGRKRCKND